MPLNNSPVAVPDLSTYEQVRRLDGKIETLENKIDILTELIMAGGGIGPVIPNNALTLNGTPLTLNGAYLVL